MKKYSIILIAFIIPFITFAQTDEPANDTPFIEVTGYAVKKVVPDEIFIQIILKERQENRETITVEKQLDDLKNALTALGIPLENLDIADAAAEYIRVKWTKRDVVKQGEYELKVKSAEEVVKVFEKLGDLDVEDADIIRVSHSKMQEFKKEVAVNAISAARDKADYLLAAIGQERGSALIVKSIDVFDDSGYLLYNSNVRGSRANDVSYYQDYQAKTITKEFIQFKKINIEANIYVKFEIVH